MPLYEYECLKCGQRTEKIEPVAGPHLRKCPHCGGKVEALISAPSIQFKGSGWYVTDYAGKSPASDSKDDKSPSEKKEESEKKEASAKDSAAKDSEKKEAAKDAKEKKPEKTTTKKK